MSISHNVRRTPGSSHFSSLLKAHSELITSCVFLFPRNPLFPASSSFKSLHAKSLLAAFLFPASLANAEADQAKDGPAIIAEASGKLIAALTAAIAEDGSHGAISVCSEKAPEIAKAVGKAHGVTLRRVTEKPRNPKNAASEADREILAAFAVEMQGGKPPEARTLTNPEGRSTFFAPIVIPAQLCLQCHGAPSIDIAPETLAAIRKRYPDDKATGYKPGDLRGAWKVTFDPKP